MEEEVSLENPNKKKIKDFDIRDTTKSVFNGINLSQKREVDESFDDYKIRMKETKRLIRGYSKGYMRWNSVGLEFDTKTKKYNKILRQGTYQVGSV